ncbi:MAG TPA: sugar porter family MFS transporter [Streptosporangiaceae bacterium]|nr:sugar porter family MFS transporter [Streptosporangiaceae bacterium]
MTATTKTGNAPGSGGNVLSALDAKVPTSFLWSLTLLATIGGFLFGYDTANIGAALNLVPYPLTGLALGYLVSGASLGAAAGALAAGPLTDRFGRKSLLIIDALIYAVGAILSAVTPNAAILLAARTLIGLAIGADSAIATAYIAEYAPRGRRGSLSMLQQWMITVGILGSYIVALVILSAWPHSAASSGWRLILGLGAVPAIVGFALRTKMPESPRWLMRHGKYDKARDALGRLGVETTVDDVERTAGAVRLADVQQRTVRSRWTPGVRRALIIVSVFFVLQQITGINVPLYYGPHLLGPLFQAGGGKVATTIAGVEVTAIMTAVNVAATYIGFRYIDKVGRRKISMAGYTGMAVSAVIAAIGLGFLDGTGRIVLVMVGLDIFIACFALGVGGTGWLIQGESFPTAVRGRAAAIAASVDWLANFALIEAFPNMQSAIGVGWVLIVFAALCALAITFIFLFLPETKGHSVEEITELFERPARQAVSASLTRPSAVSRPAGVPQATAGVPLSGSDGGSG